MEFALVIIVFLIIAPIFIGIIAMLFFRLCKNRGIAIEKIVCNIIAFSPFILMLAEDLFPAFFESWGFLILIGLIVATCAVMIRWKEESHGIEAVCAFITMLYGANGFINAGSLQLSFVDLVTSFCFIISGIGCWRYLIKKKQ